MRPAFQMEVRIWLTAIGDCSKYICSMIYLLVTTSREGRCRLTNSAIRTPESNSSPVLLPNKFSNIRLSGTPN